MLETTDATPPQSPNCVSDASGIKWHVHDYCTYGLLLRTLQSVSSCLFTTLHLSLPTRPKRLHVNPKTTCTSNVRFRHRVPFPTTQVTLIRINCVRSIALCNQNDTYKRATPAHPHCSIDSKQKQKNVYCLHYRFQAPSGLPEQRQELLCIHLFSGSMASHPHWCH